MPKSLSIPPRNEMQMTSSQTLLFPLQLIVPGVESVASCLVDGMLFIILQVRSGHRCLRFLRHDTTQDKTYDYSEHLDVTSPSEVPLDTFISPPNSQRWNADPSLLEMRCRWHLHIPSPFRYGSVSQGRSQLQAVLLTECFSSFSRFVLSKPLPAFPLL
jgi:hypothetical protein